MFKTLRALFSGSHPPSSARSLIIDPGCQNALGHHAGLNRTLADHLRQSGRVVKTFVHQDCSPELVAELAAEPSLFPGIYQGVPDEPAELTSRLTQRNNRLYQELQTHVGPLQPGDQIIVHSMTVWGFAGLAKWLADVGSTAVSAHIMVMFPPELDFVDVTQPLMPQIQKTLADAFDQSLRQLKAAPVEVHWSTQSKRLTDRLEPILGTTIKTLHLPVDFGAEIPSEAQADTPVFLFPGAGRKEKGIGNLPGAIRRFVHAGGQGRFIVQSVDDDAIKSELAALPNVEILDRHLSAQAYNQQINDADAVIVAYDPARYAERAGHIVIEALGSGRPVIVTKGTWMEEVLADLPVVCGTIAADYGADALGDALLEFVRERQALRANAQASAQSIRDQHSRSAFLNAFLA